MVAVCGCGKVEERNWVTMGTTASLKTKHAREDEINSGLKRARVHTESIERLLNAHCPESELSKLAALSDDEILEECDPSVKPCYKAAFLLRDQSGGAFNPRWKGAKTMDLGGIAKGYAVDVLCRNVYVGDGRQQVLFDIGGNLRCQRGEWTVGVAGSERTLVLKKGEACATSGEYFRGKHIVDARTGAAVSNDLYSVTVVHPSSAMIADGLSTICFILGEAEGEAFLNKHYPEARAIWIKKE